MPLRRISKLWVAISLLLIAGGIILAEVVLATQRIHSGNETYAIYALGSLLGGFQAARMSPGKTLLEPTIAALIIALSMAIIDPVMNMKVFAESFTRPSAPLSLGLVAFAAALAGARLGERVSPLYGRESGWSLSAMLMLVGAAYPMVVFTGVTKILLGDDAAIFFMASFLGAPLLAGLLLQLGAPHHVGSAFFGSITLFVTLGFVLSARHGLGLALLTAFMTLCGSLFATILGFFGATLARLRKRSRELLEGEHAAASVPEARVRTSR